MRTDRLEAAKEAVSLLLGTGKTPLLVAIDGMCGAGKTTLGTQLAEAFSANLFHMDDFYLRREQRTPARLGEVGGNVDYERFAEEVLEPVRTGSAVFYRPIIHGSFVPANTPHVVPPRRVNIIEGSYSLHPYFGDAYDLRLFLEIDPAVQVARIRERNGEEMLKRFLAEWIPKENAYFARFAVRDNCLVL